MVDGSEAKLIRYPFASHLNEDAGALELAASFDQPASFFFEGKLAQPRRVAQLLRALMDVVQARFHIPANMLEKLLAESDPVVTAGAEQLRFEGFSACCGLYVRLDLLDSAFDGPTRGRGTTNVDFNQPMLSALAKVRRTQDVELAVGRDQFVLRQGGAEVVEKKVKLPLRWMKGFVEVQASQRRMSHVHSIAGPQAHRFLRTLPRSASGSRAAYMHPTKDSLRLSQTPGQQSFSVGGLQRLRLLERLARDAERLDVYAETTSGVSGWVLTYSDCRFTLVLSPSTWRGFSGEGAALTSLTQNIDAFVPSVRATLNWQSVVDAAELERTFGIEPEQVEAVLDKLSTQGLLGFDLFAQAYFHRELPFDVSLVGQMQPRFVAAKKLLRAHAVVELGVEGDTRSFDVESSGVKHRVRLLEGSAPSFACTCPWYGKHGVERGPCKHVLAAQLFLEEKDV